MIDQTTSPSTNTPDSFFFPLAIGPVLVPSTFQFTGGEDRVDGVRVALAVAEIPALVAGPLGRVLFPALAVFGEALLLIVDCRATISGLTEETVTQVWLGA